jgi:hypothetical protein
VSKARSGLHICGPETAEAALALPGSGGAQPDTIVTQPSAQRIESLDASTGHRPTLALGRTQPSADRDEAFTQVNTAPKAAWIRQVIRRENIQ